MFLLLKRWYIYIKMRKPLLILIIVAFLINTVGLFPLVQAQDYRLPAPGVMVHLSPPIDPPILKGIKVHPDNPFRFDFILDKGDGQLGNDQLKDESSKLIKYFLTSLTIPEKDLWVNLSPYEKDRIIPNSFGLTSMGRDLLGEDYMLKQITASLIYPEDKIGKKFWKRIYEEAAKRYGTTNIPVNTFNKVWIVPEKAVVYENTKAGTAYVVKSKLKVMLEQDYLSLEKHEGIQSERTQTKDTNQLGSQVVREIVIPELTTEVNENKNFAQLRQVYNSLILATWYKKKIKDSILEQVYVNKNKVAGVNIDNPKEKEKIYQQYLKAFKKGVYNYIKEDVDPATQETIPRKYFSGGVDFAMSGDTTLKGINNLIESTSVLPVAEDSKPLIIIEERTQPLKTDSAMQSSEQGINPEDQIKYEQFKSWIETVSTERLKNKIVSLDMLETLLHGLSNDSYSYVRKANADALAALIAGGLVSKEDVKEKGIVETLLHGLSNDSDSDVRKANADALAALIAGGLVSKEDELSKEEIQGMFKDVYGRDLPIGGMLNYLKFLTILKDDNPVAAYQIANWSVEQLKALFDIFNAFNKSVALDATFRKEGSNENFLEKELIKDALHLISNPTLFLAHLKDKFKKAINDSSVKLAIRVYEVASVNAAKGLIQAAGLNKDRVVILYDKEIDSEQASRFFPGYVVQAFNGFNEQGIVRVEFHDYGNMTMSMSGDSLSASLPYTPFKFNLPTRASEEVNSMKESLGIGSERKVIVIGSPSDTEFNEFIQAYNSLYKSVPYPQRPLLIIGFRQRRNENELKLLGSLSGQSIAVRSDATAPLPDVKSNNVLILNTAGELLKMYALANLAIVGHDRNIFEPASQEAAVLYFDGSWTNNRDGKDSLVNLGAAKVFSKENLEELINSSDETAEMGKKGAEAVEAYRSEVQSKTQEFVFQIIGARPQLRKSLIDSPAYRDQPIEQKQAIVQKTLTKEPVIEANVRDRVEANLVLDVSANYSGWALWPIGKIWNGLKKFKQYFKGGSDKAQIANPEYGGIDLTPANMHLLTQNNGETIKFHINPAMLKQLQNAPGFVPVIISIQPMTNLRQFLSVPL